MNKIDHDTSPTNEPRQQATVTFMIMRTLYIFPLALLLACNHPINGPEDDGGGGQNSSMQGGGGSITSGGNSGSGGASLGTCTQLPTQPVMAATEASFAAELVGQWSICDQSAFGTGDDAGIEFDADGTWYTLYESGSQLVRATANDKWGTWSVIWLTSPNAQVDLVRDAGGTNHMGVTVGEGPRMLYMDNSGFFEGWYNFVPSN